VPASALPPPLLVPPEVLLAPPLLVPPEALFAPPLAPLLLVPLLLVPPKVLLAPPTPPLTPLLLLPHAPIAAMQRPDAAATTDTTFIDSMTNLPRAVLDGPARQHGATHRSVFRSN